MASVYDKVTIIVDGKVVRQDVPESAKLVAQINFGHVFTKAQLAILGGLLEVGLGQYTMAEGQFDKEALKELDLIVHREWKKCL